MDGSERAQPPASLAQRAAGTRWITPGTGLIVGLITAGIVVVRVARVEVERLHDALLLDGPHPHVDATERGGDPAQ